MSPKYGMEVQIRVRVDADEQKHVAALVDRIVAAIEGDPFMNGDVLRPEDWFTDGWITTETRAVMR